MQISPDRVRVLFFGRKRLQSLYSCYIMCLVASWQRNPSLPQMSFIRFYSLNMHGTSFGKQKEQNTTAHLWGRLCYRFASIFGFAKACLRGQGTQKAARMLRRQARPPVSVHPSSATGSPAGSPGEHAENLRLTESHSTNRLVTRFTRA